MSVSVYILYSASLDLFYTGFTTGSVLDRLEKHNMYYYNDAFTSRAKDWQIFLTIECKSDKQARLIESHIKRMKSRTYILNLKKYPNIIQQLFSKYVEN